jgi:hypothetical protein
MPARPDVHGSVTISHGGRLLLITKHNKKGDESTLYVVEDIRPNPAVASPAYNLYKADGEAYTVRQDKHGIECTCPDFHWSRQRNRQDCKHIKSLRAVGKLPPAENTT